MYFIFVNCTIFSWLQKHYMLIMESLESIEKQKEKQETEMKEGRGNGRKKWRREDGKHRRRKERERKKIKEGKGKKKPQLLRGNFSQYFHVHSFQCILCNLIKIATYTVGWMYSFIVYFFIMNKTYLMPLISYLSV